MSRIKAALEQEHLISPGGDDFDAAIAASVDTLADIAQSACQSEDIQSALNDPSVDESW